MKKFEHSCFKKLVLNLKRTKTAHRIMSSFFILIMLVAQSQTVAYMWLDKTVSAQSTQVPSLNVEEQSTTSINQDAPVIGQDPNRPITTLLAEKELPDLRTDNTETKVNSDGSYTTTVFNDAKYYKKDGEYVPIDSTIIEDKNAADSSGFFGKMWGNIRSFFVDESTYKIEANDWQARFAPIDDAEGMLRYQKEGLEIAFNPDGGRHGVKPAVVPTDDGQVVRYSDVWQGVDIEYLVTGSKIKEFIVIKDAQAASTYGFNISGAELIEDPDHVGGFKVKDHDVAIAPISVSLNEDGPISEQVASMTFKDGKLVTSIDTKWLQGLDASNFPVVIDPTVTNGSIGLTYVAYKSDGYVCSSSSCYMNAGAVSNNGWKMWRTAFRTDYSFLQGKELLGAGLFLSKKNPPPNSWFGTSESLYYEVSHANCLCFNGINYSLPRTSSWFGQDGWIDVRPQYQALMNIGDYGGWLMLNGEERAYTTLKMFNDNSYVNFTYNSPIPEATPVTPADKQVFVTNQPSFRVNPVIDPEAVAGDQYKYYFRIATNPDGETGTVINSGDIAENQWTVPEGVLQDGMTYYWKAYISEWHNGNLYRYKNTSWVRSFKIDMRTGKDSTQTYDTAGPISVGLATGNVTTSANSQSINALGGDIGIGLNYNSPAISKPGLVGEYFNNTTLSGSPVLSRVDQNVDFNWGTGSPSSGLVSADNFSIRWKGYFVAPASGNYQFGGTNDDGMTIKLTVNSNEQTVYSSACYSTTPCFGTTVALTEGQIVPIKFEYVEGTATAYTSMYVKGPVAQQIIPSDWLRTELRTALSTSGLKSYYYTDPGTHILPTDTSSAFVSRNETKMNFVWGAGSPAPTGPTDNWMASYEGYITAPVSGMYQIGTVADDAVRIYINGNLVLNDYAADGAVTTMWSSSFTLNSGQSVPIRIEYYELAGTASLQVSIKGTVAQQELPTTWLSTKAEVLPKGWQLGFGTDGNLSYDFAKINTQSVVLSDSSGSTHEYKWNGSSYMPPTNEYGMLVRNSDGSLTLQDSDGKTYIFNNDGRLREVSTPTDDRKPSALKYEYGGTPARLTKISDAVDATRSGTVHYKNDTACPSIPNGFDAVPNNMLCAFKTTDGDQTNFFYKNGQLARIELPGGNITDLGYDAFGRIIQHRSSFANDVVAAGLRTNDASVTTEIMYDLLGRASKIVEPAANTGDVRREHSYSYKPNNITQLNTSGTSEPNGYTTKIEYDSLFRTVKAYDKSGLMSQVEYDPVKDLVLSATSPTDLKSTTIYDANDLPVESYGPAPKTWFGADRKPLAAYVSQVPRTDTKYDEGINGASVAWYDFKNTNGGALIGAPKLHTTGFEDTNPDDMFWMNTSTGSISPVVKSSSADGYGFRATALITVPTTGTYALEATHDDAGRLFVDDQLIIDKWSNRSGGSTVTTTANVVLQANKPYKFRFDYANADNGVMAFKVVISGSGINNVTTRLWGSMMKPDYNLKTSTKVYDSVIGDVTASVSYGANPELGMAQSSTIDPTGLNLTSGGTYEAPGTPNTYLRQTSKSLPGGNTTTYAYYGATETADNPCTVANDPVSQAGFAKLTTEQDPDGNGSQTSRTKEVRYDVKGRVVASRMNNDPWSCTSFDSRGRVTKAELPSINSRQGRTIEYYYDIASNPLKSRVVDSVVGTAESEVDLLGRTKWSKDIWGYEYTVSYDANGRVASSTGPVGIESSDYDSLDRPTNYKLDGVVYATVTYDGFGRVQTIEYPEAKDTLGNKLKLTQVKRDALQRTIGAVYQTSDAKTFDETVSLSQVGKITGATQAYDGQTLTSSFSFDKLGRTTSATVGQTKFDYGYSAPNASCSALSGNNANAHKDSNRTNYTVTNLATSSVVSSDTNCYDLADKLITSSDVQVGTPTYDDHGNTVSLAGNGVSITFNYDASDYNTSIEQGTNKVEYVKTASGSIVRKKEYQNGVLTKSYRYVAGSRILQTCSLTDDNACTSLDTYLSLPGAITLTKSPTNPDTTKQTIYSLKNFHGDTALTLTSQGKTDTTVDPVTGLPVCQGCNLIKGYGPFGESLIPGTLGSSTTSTLSNSSNEPMGWAASPTRKQESGFSVPIIQMGARVYISSLGRFLSVDPIEGGTLNPYVYAHDPVNMDDYSGLFSLPSMLTSVGRAFNNIVRSAAKTIAKMQSKSLIKASVTTANLVAIKKISSQNSNPLSTGIYGQPIHPFFQSLNPNYYFKLSPGRPPASPQSVAAFDGCAMGVGVATILTIATAGGAVIAFGGAAAACAQGAATSVIVQSLDTSNEEKNQINSKWQAVELIFEGLNVYDKVR